MMDIITKVGIMFGFALLMVILLPVQIWFDKKFINRHSKRAYAQICMGELLSIFIGMAFGFVMALI